MSESTPSASALRAVHLVERLARLLRAGDHAGGLNPAQWEALRYLARCNRFSSNPGALAAYLGSTRGTVSQTLIALEAKSLVTKRADPRDGRAVLLTLTTAGRARLAGDTAQQLAVGLDRTTGAVALADSLEAAVRAALTERGGRVFGVCATCQHFRRDVAAAAPAAPHHCALLDEPLSDADAAAICSEHAA